MKKVIIIGCPGSGKSTFSIRLESIIKLPLYHIDMMYWNQDKTKVDREVFLKRLSDTINLDKWIIDGNYYNTLEERIKQADTIFLLDYPLDVCLSGIEERMGKKRDDNPFIEEGVDEEFLDFIKNFHRDLTPKIMDLLNKYSNNKMIYIFTSRKQGDAYLDELERKYHEAK